MGTRIKALIVSDDPNLTELLSRLLSCKLISVECRQRLNDSLTLKKLPETDLLLIDFFNVRKDLPVLLSLLENRYSPKEVILITSSPVFNLIWKFLEKHDYSLILKPGDLGKMNAMICNVIAKIKQKRGLLEKRANIHDRNTDMQFSDHFQLGISACNCSIPCMRRTASFIFSPYRIL